MAVAVAQHSDLRLLHQGVDTLPRQVFPVVEILEDRRIFQPAVHRDAIAIAQPQRTVYSQQRVAIHRQWVALVGQCQAFSPQANTHPGVARFGRFHHHAGDRRPGGVVERTVVKGQIGRGETRQEGGKLKAQRSQQEQEDRRRWQSPARPVAAQDQRQRRQREQPGPDQRPRRVATHHAH